MSLEYNNLPTIDAAHEQSKSYSNAPEKLVQIVKSHGLSDKLAVRIIHKHFDLRHGEIALFRTVRAANVDAYLLSPVSAASVNAAPINYAIQDKKLVPVEYTTDDSQLASGALDSQEYAAFRSAYIAEAEKLGVSNLYGISVLPKKEAPPDLTEGEIAGYRATITVPKALFTKAGYTGTQIPNNWKATSKGGVAAGLFCIQIGPIHIGIGKDAPGELGEVINGCVSTLY